MGCQSPLGCYEVQKQKKKKAKWARLSPSQNVGVEERKSFKKWGVRFPHKASLQHVLSMDTALAISPFFLLHYLLPVAPIAYVLWFKDWWSVLILRNLALDWEGHCGYSTEGCSPCSGAMQQKTTGAEVSSSFHPLHRVCKSCVAYLACRFPTLILRFLQYLFSYGLKVALNTLSIRNFHLNFYMLLPFLLSHYPYDKAEKPSKKVFEPPFPPRLSICFQETLLLSKPLPDNLNLLGINCKIKWGTYRFLAGDNTLKASWRKPTFLLQVPLAKPHVPTRTLALHCLMGSLCMHRTPLECSSSSASASTVD